jgi:hypothetical protein
VSSNKCSSPNIITNPPTNTVALVRERTIPT